MIVVDSSGWLQFLTDGPLADQYATRLRQPAGVVTPTIIMYEVYKHSKRLRGEDGALGNRHHLRLSTDELDAAGRAPGVTAARVQDVDTGVLLDRTDEPLSRFDLDARKSLDRQLWHRPVIIVASPAGTKRSIASPFALRAPCCAARH